MKLFVLSFLLLVINTLSSESFGTTVVCQDKNIKGSVEITIGNPGSAKLILNNGAVFSGACYPQRSENTMACFVRESSDKDFYINLWSLNLASVRAKSPNQLGQSVTLPCAPKAN